MKNLQEATERICELKGSMIAMDSLIPALLETLSPAVHDELVRSFEAHAEAARTVMLHTDISEHVLAAFERDVARTRAVLGATTSADRPAEPDIAAEAVLLTTTRVSPFIGPRPLSGASGFFFRRDGRLFLVTSRHVVIDEASGHLPDRIEIEVHTDGADLSRYETCSLPLHDQGVPLWREASDGTGPVDVVAIEIQPHRLPATPVLQAFEAAHLEPRGDRVSVGDALTVVGFPLGFHDTVHRLAVARSASIASAYGVRYQRQGCFLTDAPPHRGSSGSPVLRRRAGQRRDGSLLPWQLLGVHSTRRGPGTSGRDEDESLGLHGAWYADVLMTLTEPPPAA